MAVLFVADLVDSFRPIGLTAGEDAAVGDRLQLLVVEMAAILHQAFEPGVGILDDRFDRGARLRRGRLEAVRRCLERRGFDLSTLTPILFSRSATFGYWNSTPIEPTSEVCLATI